MLGFTSSKTWAKQGTTTPPLIPQRKNKLHQQQQQL
jgi:hypothetical protein